MSEHATAPFSAESITRSMELDPMLRTGLMATINAGRASISKFQRHLGIGYTRASQMVQAMIDAKIVDQAGTCLITYEQWTAVMGELARPLSGPCACGIDRATFSEPRLHKPPCPQAHKPIDDPKAPCACGIKRPAFVHPDLHQVGCPHGRTPAEVDRTLVTEQCEAKCAAGHSNKFECKITDSQLRAAVAITGKDKARSTILNAVTGAYGVKCIQPTCSFCVTIPDDYVKLVTQAVDAALATISEPTPAAWTTEGISMKHKPSPAKPTIDLSFPHGVCGPGASVKVDGVEQSNVSRLTFCADSKSGVVDCHLTYTMFPTEIHREVDNLVRHIQIGDRLYALKDVGRAVPPAEFPRVVLAGGLPKAEAADTTAPDAPPMLICGRPSCARRFPASEAKLGDLCPDCGYGAKPDWAQSAAPTPPTGLTGLIARFESVISALQYDSKMYAELLLTMSLPQNRSGIRAGKPDVLDALFTLIDTHREAHEMRMKSIEHQNCDEQPSALPHHGPGVCLITADGVPFHDGMRCWDRNGEMFIIELAEAFKIRDGSWSLAVLERGKGRLDFKNLYSTYEAAMAAKASPAAGNSNGT